MGLIFLLSGSRAISSQGSARNFVFIFLFSKGCQKTPSITPIISDFFLGFSWISHELGLILIKHNFKYSWKLTNNKLTSICSFSISFSSGDIQKKIWVREYGCETEPFFFSRNKKYIFLAEPCFKLRHIGPECADLILVAIESDTWSFRGQGLTALEKLTSSGRIDSILVKMRAPLERKYFNGKESIIKGN